MKTEEIIEFLRQYDLGWEEEVWTIAKKDVKEFSGLVNESCCDMDEDAKRGRGEKK